MVISPQRLTIYLYSAHRAVIFAIAQLSCSSKVRRTLNRNAMVLYDQTIPRAAKAHDFQHEQSIRLDFDGQQTVDVRPVASRPGQCARQHTVNVSSIRRAVQSGDDSSLSQLVVGVDVEDGLFVGIWCNPASSSG